MHDDFSRYIDVGVDRDTCLRHKLYMTRAWLGMNAKEFLPRILRPSSFLDPLLEDVDAAHESP